MHRRGGCLCINVDAALMVQNLEEQAKQAQPVGDFVAGSESVYLLQVNSDVCFWHCSQVKHCVLCCGVL